MFLFGFAVIPPGPDLKSAVAASPLTSLNASRFGNVDTKSCSVGFLLGHFLRFEERPQKNQVSPAAAYTGFVMNFYGLKQGNNIKSSHERGENKYAFLPDLRRLWCRKYYKRLVIF